MYIDILSQQFCQYSLSIKGYSPYTVRRYRTCLAFFCRATGATTLGDVTEASVRAFFYSGRIDRNWSTNTYAIYHKSLLVFFRWCAKQGYMEGNPAADIEIPKKERKLPRKLTRQDALRLLELVYNYPYEYSFLRYRNHAIFSTLVYAGLRKQELLSLRLTDVDTENLSIFVRQGKGNRDRIIPMSATLAQTLRRYGDERKRLRKTCPEFFCTLRGSEPFTVSGLSKLISQLRTSLRLHFSAHTLRHTFATLMLEGGCDIYSLSKMMGHSDIKTTTIYLAASADHLRLQMTKHPLN